MNFKNLKLGEYSIQHNKPTRQLNAVRLSSKNAKPDCELYLYDVLQDIDFDQFNETIRLSNDVEYTISVDSDIDGDIDEMIAYVVIQCNKRLENIKLGFFDRSKLQLRAHLMNERLTAYVAELQNRFDKMKRKYTA